MDEKQLQALYNAMHSSLDLGDYATFKNTIVSDPKYRKAIYDQASNDLDLGDYDTWNKTIGFDSPEVKAQSQKKNLGGNTSANGFQSPLQSQSPSDGVDNAPVIDLNGQIQGIRDNQEKASKRDISTVPKVDEGGSFPVYQSGHGIFDEQKKAQTELDNSVEALGRLWNHKPEDIKQVINDVPVIGSADRIKELADLKRDNPQKYDRQTGAINWQYPLHDAIYQKEDKQNADAIWNAVYNAQINEHKTYDQAREDYKVAEHLIYKYIDDSDTQKKLIDNLQKDASINYAGAIAGTDESMALDPMKPYLNRNEMLGLNYIRDTDPAHSNFDNLQTDPTKLDKVKYIDAKGAEKFDTVDVGQRLGYQEQKQKLAQAGLSLRIKAASEHLAGLKKKGDTQGLTPEEQQAYQGYQNEYNTAQDEYAETNNPNNKDYGMAAAYNIKNVAQELVGQKHGFFATEGLKFLDEAGSGVNSIVQGLSSAFNSDENNKRMQMSVIGQGTKHGSETYVKQSNRALQTEEIAMPDELKKQIDAIKNDKNLSDNEKIKQASDLLATNKDWYKKPVDSKFNLTGNALLYGLGDATNTLGSFILNDAVLGGLGNVSKAKKAVTTIGAMMLTDYNKTYENNLRNNTENPAGSALRDSFIKGAAFAVGDNVGLIRNLVKGKAAEDLIGKMTDDEILAVAKKAPTTLGNFTKGFAGTLKEAAVGSAQMTASGMAGTLATDAMNNNLQKPEDYFKQNVIGLVTNFPLLMTMGGFGKSHEISALQGHAWYEMASKPEQFMKAADDAVANGSLSESNAKTIKENIQLAADIHAKIPYVDAKGNPLGDEDKTQLLLKKIRQQGLVEKSKADNPPTVQAKADIAVAKGEADMNLLYQPKTKEQLEKRQEQIETKLEPKTEDSKEPTDKEKIELKGELAAIKDKLKEPEATVTPKPAEATTPSIEGKGEGDVKSEPIKEFVSKNGKQKLVVENGVQRIVDIATGKEVSRSTSKKVLSEAANSFDYTKGEKAVVDETIPFKDDKEYNSYVIEKSSSPSEIAEIFTHEEPEAVPLSTKEQMIADYGIGKVTEKSYQSYGDRNNQNRSKALSYFSKDGTPIDSLAKELSDHYGVDITPQDVVDFIDNYPNGAAQALKTSESEVSLRAKEKFQELTGLPLNNETANIALKQEFEKLDKSEQELAQHNYESREQLEAEYWKQFGQEINGKSEDGNNTETKPSAQSETEKVTNAKAQEKAQVIQQTKDAGVAGSNEPKPTETSIPATTIADKVGENTPAKEIGDTPPPPTEPPVSGNESTGGGSVVYKMRSLQKNLVNRSTALTPEQKALAKTDTNAMYSVLPKAESRRIALEVIQEIGIEKAVALASSKTSALEPSERAMILGAAMDYYAGKAKEASKKGDVGSEKENADLEIEANEKFAEVTKTLGELGTAYGRAISLFGEIYKLSNIALSRKLEKRTQKLNELIAPEADNKAKEIVTIIGNEEAQVKDLGDALSERELQAQTDFKLEKAALEKEITDLKKQIAENTGKPKGSKANPLQITRKTNDTEYDRRVKEFKSRHRTGLNKDDLSDLTYFGLYHLENGVTKFGDWYKAMAGKFGKFKEHLPDIYNKSKEDAVSNGADKNSFDDESSISNFFNKDKTAKEYRTLETERNRQIARVTDLKEKLANLEKDGLPVTEGKEVAKDTPEIEALKQQVKDLETGLRKKESDAKATETNIEKLTKELTRVRERRAKEKTENKPASKELSDAEKDIITQIKSESAKWAKEKENAAKAKKEYALLETERNRQMKRFADLNEKLNTLKSGKRPETKTGEAKTDTPEIEKLKADIKTESEKLSAIESQQKRVNDLETELQRLKDRKPKEPSEKSEREASDREKELKEQIAAEKRIINEEWKASPEYQAESDAKKMAQITKRQAISDLNQVMANNPDRARVLAPRLAAKRIRQDAARNLDTPTTKNEQTYLQRLVQVVNNKAKEYYKGKNEKISGNDVLQFAIANGKKDYKIWENTQEELSRQIDADTKLNDVEKAEVKDFLKDYVDSTFETLLTENQKRKIVNEKLIEAGFVTERVINGKPVKSVDWKRIIGNSKNIKEAKDAITKAVTDLGFTAAEAKNEINALLDLTDSIVADKLTKDTNAFLNKSIIDKAKGFFGQGVGKSKIQRLIDLKNKGILDVKEARKVLSDQLGIHEVSAEDYAKVKDLLEIIDIPNLPVYVRKRFEEQVQYIFEKYGGNMMYLKHREFALSNQLSSPANFIQNLSGLNRVPSKAIITAIKTGNPRMVLSILKNEAGKSLDVARSVAFKGDVSRGTAYDDFNMAVGGNPKVRYTEYGENRLLGIPNKYVQIGGKTININLLNEGMSATSKVVGRGLEATDTFASNPIAALQIYENLRNEVKALHPEYDRKTLESKVYDLMYGEDIAAAKAEALTAMTEAGLTPTEYQLNRAAHEAAERKINEKLSKYFYDTVEKMMPDAKARLETKGVKDPTEEQIKDQVYQMLGRDAPMDIVASGEREAAVLTGKKTTPGIMWVILKPIEILQTGLRKSVTKEHSTAGKLITNTADAATQIIAPFATSIGRWIEFGLELTPYGVVKGLGYHVFAKNVGRLEGIKPAEAKRMGTDFILRSVQGAAQTMIGFWILAAISQNEDDEADDLVTGIYQDENYNKEKVEKVGKPKRSININGHNIPIDLLGSAGMPYMMYSDYLKRRKDVSFNEKHAEFYTGVAVYMENMTQAYLSINQRYGGMLGALQSGKDDKFGQSAGTIVGQTAGKYLIPFNRFQNDIAQLWNPQSQQSIDFGTNALQQLSIVRGFEAGKPNFDYRGRKMDIGDMYAMSPDGMKKMFEKSKYGDDIDTFLATVDFAATDAYRESKEEESYKYSIVNKDGTNRFMTPDEYYDFKLETAKKFDELLKLNYRQIEKVDIQDTKFVTDEDETLKTKKELLSQLLTASKEYALTQVQASTKAIPDQEAIDKAKEKKAESKERQLRYLKLEGVD